MKDLETTSSSLDLLREDLRTKCATLTPVYCAGTENKDVYKVNEK